MPAHPLAADRGPRRLAVAQLPLDLTQDSRWIVVQAHVRKALDRAGEHLRSRQLSAGSSQDVPRALARVRAPPPGQALEAPELSLGDDAAPEPLGELERALDSEVNQVTWWPSRAHRRDRTQHHTVVAADNDLARAALTTGKAHLHKPKIQPPLAVPEKRDTSK